MESSNPSIVNAFRKGWLYRKLEGGYRLGAFEKEFVESFNEVIREKVNVL